jgi:hypothetical protein
MVEINLPPPDLDVKMLKFIFKAYTPASAEGQVKALLKRLIGVLEGEGDSPGTCQPLEHVFAGTVTSANDKFSDNNMQTAGSGVGVVVGGGGQTASALFESSVSGFGGFGGISSVLGGGRRGEEEDTVARLCSRLLRLMSERAEEEREERARRGGGGGEIGWGDRDGGGLDSRDLKEWLTGLLYLK